MPKKQTAEKHKPWVIPDGSRATGNAVARLFGISHVAVLKWPDCPRVMDGKRQAYNLPDVVAWRIEKLVEAGKPKDSNADPLMTGDAKDEWTIRYRRAKALEGELSLAERQKELIPTDHVRQILSRMGSILRRGAESIQRAYGDAALVVFEAMRDEWMRELEVIMANDLQQGDLVNDGDNPK